MNRPSRTIFPMMVGIIAGFVALSGGCDHPANNGDVPLRTLRLSTGTPGGEAHRRAEVLARAYRAAYSDVSVELRETRGSIANLETIQRAEVDVGFAFADDAYEAFIGRFGDKPFDRLRGIALLQLYPLHLIVSAESGIRDIRELRGRRVAVGPPGSETFVLRAFGIDPQSVVVKYIGGNEATRRLRAGDLDGMFVLGGLPAESVNLATNAGARLLPIEGPAVERLRQEYPFLHLVAIPPYTYSTQSTAVHTIGIHNLLVCRSDLDEQLVYELTKTFFATLPELASIQPSVRLIDISQAPATPVPLHDGAGRYYRERELSR